MFNTLFTFFKINQVDLSENNILHLYKTYKIEPNSNAETSFKKLSRFLKDLFQNEKELFQRNRITGNQ